MSRFHLTRHHLRTAAAIAPVRPAWGAGLRAAVATVVPLAAAYALGLGMIGTWASIAGLNGALVDRSGTYRGRALTIVGQALLTALAVALGALVGPHVAAAIALTLVVGVAASLGRAWGNTGANVGSNVLLAFVVSLAFPAALGGGPLVRAAAVVAGGGWVLVLTVVFWPLHPNRPARRAIGGAYRALAAYAEELAERAVPGAAPDAAPHPWTALPRPAAVRTAIDGARGVLAAGRRGRPGQTRRGEELVVLLEQADRTFVHLRALGDAVESIPAAARDPAAETVLAETLAVAGATLRALADAAEAERRAPDVPVAWSGATLADVAAAGSTPECAVPYTHAAQLLDRVAGYARAAAEATAALAGRRPTPERAPAAASDGPGPSALAHGRERLREALSPDSILRRHALRIGIVTAIAVALTLTLGLEHGHWMTITAVVILQPYTGITTQRALQRLAGTVLGALLTAALSTAFRDPVAILALAFAFSGICVALLPLSYAAFSVFLTPTFVLIAELGAGDWHLAGPRVVNTLLGAGLALAGARLLWPTPEWSRLPAHLADALRASAEYLRASATVLAAPASPGRDAALVPARRAAGVATINAEESFQRLLGEHRGPPEALEPAMALLAGLRRLAAAASALVLLRERGRDGERPSAPDPRPAALASVADVLHDLEGAVRDRRAPRPLPDPPSTAEGADGPLLRARLVRLARVMRALHAAVAQWVGPAGAPGPVAPPATDAEHGRGTRGIASGARRGVIRT